MHDIELLPPGSFWFLGVVFSPDSENVYYLTESPGGIPTVLYRIPATGGSPQKIAVDLESPVTFSPDGKSIAFIRESRGYSTLTVANLDSGAQRKLASRKLPVLFDYPPWSPDGRIIACTELNPVVAGPKGSGVRIVEVQVPDGTDKRLSEQTWSLIRQLSWLPDGSALVMSARDEDTGAFHVWRISYPDAVARKITSGLNSQTGVSVSADSRQIVTIEQSTMSGIWNLRADGSGDAEPVSRESENCDSPVWTPDGRILFEQQLNGLRQIWSMADDGADRKQLTQLGNNYAVSTSADGRMLAYLSDRGGHIAIWRMDSDGANQREVIRTVSSYFQPFLQLSPDGKWIAFVSFGERWSTLHRVSSNGGPVTDLNDKLWWARLAVSPDGQWIAGFHAARPSGTQVPDSLAIIGAEGGQPWKVLPVPQSAAPSPGVRWSPDGRALTYVEQRARRRQHLEPTNRRWKAASGDTSPWVSAIQLRLVARRPPVGRGPGDEG